MSAQDAVDDGTLEDDGKIIYYHRGHGRSWLLSWNYANPEEDDQYEAFSSEADLRKWCRSELGYVRWEQIRDARLWRGVVRGTPEEEDE